MNENAQLKQQVQGLSAYVNDAKNIDANVESTLAQMSKQKRNAVIAAAGIGGAGGYFIHKSMNPQPLQPGVNYEQTI
jgi:uncharacterized protein YlxW (UPF0749 family)